MQHFDRSGRFRIRVPVMEAVDALVSVVGGASTDIVMCTCVSLEGLVGASECFAPPGNNMNLEMDRLFEFAVRGEVAAVMMASKSSGSIQYLHERDIEFTNRVRDHGRQIGLPLFEHVVIEDDSFRFMSHSMGWATDGCPQPDEILS